LAREGKKAISKQKKRGIRKMGSSGEAKTRLLISGIGNEKRKERKGGRLFVERRP